MAWNACNKLDKIWRSSINNKLKVQVFRAVIEPILLYGAETWTLTTRLERKLDGTYTLLLRKAQNICWKQHPSIRDIYGDLPRVSHRLRQRRAQFAGHCLRASEEVVSSLLLWRPRGKTHSRKLTFPRLLSRDTGLAEEDLGAVMSDRQAWAEVVHGLTPSPPGVD